jgi:HEPN domain-containing protein
LITKDTKEKLVQEFEDLMQHLEKEDYDEINNRLVDIVRNVRKTYTVSRDDDSTYNEIVES